MAVIPLLLVWRKCHSLTEEIEVGVITVKSVVVKRHYLIEENESWRYNHYFRCGVNIITSLRKPSHGAVKITSGVEEMSLLN